MEDIHRYLKDTLTLIGYLERSTKVYELAMCLHYPERQCHGSPPKQTVITHSTMEAEFVALDKYAQEAECLRQFLEDSLRWKKHVTAIGLHCDSQSAIGRAQSVMYKGQSRHIRQ